MCAAPLSLGESPYVCPALAQPATLVDIMPYIPPLREDYPRVMDAEFTFWQWQDGGQYARYVCEEGRQAGKYRSLRVERFNTVAGYFFLKSGANPKSERGKRNLEAASLTLRSMAVSFVTTTATVIKA
jgi:hypothetical protein